MTMSAVMHDALNGALKDVKLNNGEKDVPAIGLVSDWFDKFEAGAKIQEANKELVEKRKDLTATVLERDKKIAELTSTLDQSQKSIEKLMENELTDKEREQYLALKQTGATEEVQARLNALVAERDQLKTKVDELSGKEKELSTRVQETTRQAAEQSEKTKLLTQIAKFGITGRPANIAVRDLMDSGMVRIELDPSTGAYRTLYRKFTPENKPLETTMDVIVQEFASSADNAFLRSGSPAGGSGDKHKSSPSGGGDATRGMSDYRAMLVPKG